MVVLWESVGLWLGVTGCVGVVLRMELRLVCSVGDTVASWATWKAADRLQALCVFMCFNV